jgi:hypothetical protein
MKIGYVPDGYGGKQILWDHLGDLWGWWLIIGDYKVNSGSDYYLVTYDECMGYMKRIDESCTKSR